MALRQVMIILGAATLGLGCAVGDNEGARDAAGGWPGRDGEGDLLPAGYQPPPCATPGEVCQTQDRCAVDPLCGFDHKCWPRALQRCDDGLACTDDSCVGLGICAHVPRPGWCLLPTVSPAGDGGVGPLQLRCFQEGARNPADPCQACVPAQGGGAQGGGAQGDSTRWSPTSGGRCDDGDPCTWRDVCVEGTCAGTYFGDRCDDGLSCTDDTCDGEGGCKGNKLRSGWCQIVGACYLQGEKEPGGSCNLCDPAKNARAWTPISTPCKIEGRCYAAGEKHHEGCAVCDPSASLGSWTVKGAKAGCLIDYRCKAAGEKDDIGCNVCDPTRSSTAWTPIAGRCAIEGRCYAAGEKHPGGCAVCDPTASATAWTVQGTGSCLIHGVCYKAGAADDLDCGACDPTRSGTAWTPRSDRCKIGGRCYAAGAANAGGCAACVPATSATRWTASGTSSCVIDGACVSAGAADPGGCGACAPATDPYAYTPVAGRCLIDGRCIASGARHPRGCGACDPGKQTTAWTVDAGGCLIDDACVASGAKHPNNCGTCDPSRSSTAWTAAAGLCLVGGTCFGSGEHEVGGCGVCDPATSAAGWSLPAGCPLAYRWSRSFGDGGTDEAAAVGLDRDGNLYVAGTFSGKLDLGGVVLTTQGGADIYLASFTPAGAHRWSRSFGGAGDDAVRGLAVDGEDNVYITGAFSQQINLGGQTLASKGSEDIYVASYTRAGFPRWSQSFGSAGYDAGHGVAADAGGWVYVTGAFSNDVAFGSLPLYSKGGHDVFLARFDAQGKHSWSKSFGSTNADQGLAIAAAEGGDTTVAGVHAGSISFGGKALAARGGSDVFLASFDAAGKHRWSRSFGSTGDDRGGAVALDRAANVYLAGAFRGQIDLGGGARHSEGGQDAFLASYSSAGTHRWSRGFGSLGDDDAYGVAASGDGDVVLTGKVAGVADFGGGPHLSFGFADLYLAGFSTLGAARWSRVHGSSANDYGRAVAAGAGGAILAVGSYSPVSGAYVTALDLGGGKLVGAGGSDIYLVRISP